MVKLFLKDGEHREDDLVSTLMAACGSCAKAKDVTAAALEAARLRRTPGATAQYEAALAKLKLLLQ